MKSPIVWTLVVVNIALLGAFVVRLSHPNSASAQANSRKPGDYLMVSASVIGASNGIVVVVDQTNGELSALSFDDSNGKLSVMPKFDLSQVFRRNAIPNAPAMQPRNPVR